jgi:hypothetical protein
MTRDKIFRACLDAVTWIDEFDRSDAAWAVDVVLARVVKALREDKAIPRRSRDEWELRLADVRNAAESDLNAELAGTANLRDVLDAIADHLAEKNTAKPRRTRKPPSRKSAQAKAETAR